MNKILLDYLEKKDIYKKPIWLMRQAGRYLPEYREVRKGFTDFLDFCYSPKDASEVTLQPIRRFHFDAAIIFSDILVIPQTLGANIIFKEGPKIRKVTLKEVQHFDFLKVQGSIEKVYEAITLTTKQLNCETLIGFAGAPWTLACYMLGTSSDEFKEVKILAYENSEILRILIEGLVNTISIHLINQIKAGAHLLQIFDSWAGLLTEELYDKYIIQPTKQIVTKVKSVYPHIKIIGFPRGSNSRYVKYLETNVDVISLDQTVNLDWAFATLGDKITLQGNLDPIALLSSDTLSLERYIQNYLEKTAKHRIIYNLGHGVLKETPVENISLLSNLVRNFKV